MIKNITLKDNDKCRYGGVLVYSTTTAENLMFLRYLVEDLLKLKNSDAVVDYRASSDGMIVAVTVKYGKYAYTLKMENVGNAVLYVHVVADYNWAKRVKFEYVNDF